MFVDPSSPHPPNKCNMIYVWFGCHVFFPSTVSAMYWMQWKKICLQNDTNHAISSRLQTRNEYWIMGGIGCANNLSATPNEPTNFVGKVAVADIDYWPILILDQGVCIIRCRCKYYLMSSYAPVEGFPADSIALMGRGGVPAYFVHWRLLIWSRRRLNWTPLVA